MKNKIFLTSMFAVMLAFPAYASLFNDPDSSHQSGQIAAGSTQEDCDSDPLQYKVQEGQGANYGTYTLTAQWTPDTCPITLDPHTDTYGATGTSSSPATLYAVFGDNVYLEITTTNAMTTSSNGLTSNPVGKTYTLTLDPNLPTGHTTSEISGSTNYAASTTAQMQFQGFYSVAQSVGTATNGTKYIDVDKFIEQDGITAGTSIQSTNGSCPTTTWHAQYTCQNASKYTPVLAGYVFDGWWTAAVGGSQVEDWCLTSDKTVFAHWTENSYSVTYVCDNQDAGVSGITPSVPSGKTNPDSVTYDSAYVFWTPADTCVVSGKTTTAWECVGDTSGDTINQTTNAAQWAVAEDVTCTAQYDTDMVNLIWKYENGQNDTYGTCNYGAGNISLPSEPSRTGYTFTGWKVTNWSGN